MDLVIKIVIFISYNVQKNQRVESFYSSVYTYIYSDTFCRFSQYINNDNSLRLPNFKTKSDCIAALNVSSLTKVTSAFEAALSSYERKGV